MDLRRPGPLPALVALATSVCLLAVSVYLVADANTLTPFGEPVEPKPLAAGGAAFVASIVAGFAAALLRMLQPKRSVTMTLGTVAGALAPAVGLVAMVHDFVLRLQQVLLVTGCLVLAGGLGLLGTASLVADGTLVGPFEEVPGKVWVVHFHFWQVQVTLWALVLLGLALSIWASEYAWVRRLRKAWSEPAPEV